MTHRQETSRAEPPPPRLHGSTVVVIGVAAGLLIGSAAYLGLNPLLEERSDWLREMQGLLFDLVPLCALLGGLIAWAWNRRRTPRA